MVVKEYVTYNEVSALTQSEYIIFLSRQNADNPASSRSTNYVKRQPREFLSNLNLN